MISKICKILSVCMLLAASSLIVSACSQDNPETYTFDGIKLGDKFWTVAGRRKPFDRICDVDPFDKRTRRIIVYLAKGCGGRNFPESTSVIFVIDYVKAPVGDNARKLDHPIKTIMWFGGSYFNARSNFPLRSGDKLKQAINKFGRPVRVIKLKRLTVYAFKSNIYVAADGQKIVGFVLGEMPESLDREHWSAISQVYRRFYVR